MSGSDLIPTDGEDKPTVEPKKKFEEVFEQLEMMSVNRGGIDFNNLSDAHRTSMLDVLKQNEDHAYEYHKQKLSNEREIKLARIKAGIFSLKTNRIIVIVGFTILAILTMCILFFKDTFFNLWVSFVTGLIGGGGAGYGYGKSKSSKED
jgi:hypothetical protein